MPGSTLFKAFVLFVALWAPFTQAGSGWQPIQETIRKSEKDTRQYQAIRLDNGMTVLLVSDPQAVKSCRHWWCRLGRWKIRKPTLGLHTIWNI